MIHLGGLGLREALEGSDFVPVLVKDRLFLGRISSPLGGVVHVSPNARHMSS